MTVVALSSHGYWGIALGIGLVAALVVAALLLMLIRSVRSIEHSVDGLLEVAPAVAANTANIPQLGAMTTREVEIKEGRAVAPTEPGLGIARDHDAIARLRVA